MPFTRIDGMKPEDHRYHIWLPENRKCLVLKKDSFTFAGVGKEDGKSSERGSSKVKATEKRKGSGDIGYRLSFELGDKEYVLDVEKDTLIARELTEENPLENADYFVLEKDVGPFEILKLGSDSNKALAVNMENKRLTIKEFPSNTTLVISDADM